MQLFVNNVRFKVDAKLKRMKKKIILLFSLFLVSQIGFSQEKEINPQLLKVYSENELNQIVQESPEKYDLLVYAIDHAIYTADFPTEKKDNISKEIEVPLGDYTYLDLGIKIENLNQFYRIKGTNKILVVKSFYVLNNEIITKLK